MFASLLVANRGEIACRIFRTARALGVRTIAVYSAADSGAKHVREADAAFALGPAPAADSYLNVSRILEAAKASGAEAIHPGYGFLSENPDFAEAVRAAGLIWVGPTPAAIRAMGLKDEAKRIAAAAGAPVVPGFNGDQNEAALAEAARAIGFPVLIKAIAGGGGRGIREVRSAGDFAGALAAARREASAAFGDDRVLIEKLIARPRHIEVQVFGDKHGGLVHLFERDCTLQRRRQKLIEEAPAPGMTASARAAMTEAALAIARAVGYDNAGTVEFIVEGPPRADNFYFMEMNTRLQVEHPVTEAVTGVDLVEWQLRVAAGEALPLRQAQISLDGWAVEARLAAEYPAADFRPSAGRIAAMTPPRGLRFDSGFDAGDGVPADYDSLLAKAIAHRPHRGEAFAALASGLREVGAVGVRTNAAFLARALTDPDFRAADTQAGALETGFLAPRMEQLSRPSPPAARVAQAAAALAHAGFLEAEGASPWDARDGFRLNAPARIETRFSFEGEERRARIAPGPAGRFTIDAGESSPPTTLRVLSAGPARPACVALETESGALEAAILAPGAVLGPEGDVHLFGPLQFADIGEAAAEDVILSPLPGRIVAVAVAPGDHVQRGAVLAVLEAMKMEHALAAPRAGRVQEVAVTAGAQVKVRALIVRLEAAAAPLVSGAKQR